MPDSLNVIYTPHPSTCQNSRAEFAIRGWGKVFLNPGKPETLGLALVKLLLAARPNDVKLENPEDYKHLGKDFKHLKPVPKEELAPEATPVLESAPEVEAEAPPSESESVPSEPAATGRKKTKKDGDA